MEGINEAVKEKGEMMKEEMDEQEEEKEAWRHRINERWHFKSD